jgi:peroxiredoxin
MRLEPQQAAPPFSAHTVGGQDVSLEQFAGKPLLLKFHRYAACPMCNLHLHDFARRFPELHARGLEAVAFFHSSAASIAAHAGAKQYPFELVADPTFRVYRRYGVETSWARLALSAFRPGFYLDWLRAMRHGFWGGKMPRQLAKMPADFLIGPDGRILIAHYGRSIGDHMPLPQIEEALTNCQASTKGRRNGDLAKRND